MTGFAGANFTVPGLGGGHGIARCTFAGPKDVGAAASVCCRLLMRMELKRQWNLIH